MPDAVAAEEPTFAELVGEVRELFQAEFARLAAHTASEETLAQCGCTLAQIRDLLIAQATQEAQRQAREQQIPSWRVIAEVAYAQLQESRQARLTHLDPQYRTN